MTREKQPIYKHHKVVGGKNTFMVCKSDPMFKNLEVDFTVDTKRLDVDYELKLPEVRLPYYYGDYTVEAGSETKYLNTKDRSMSDNITVLPIQAHWEENETGGYTVTIGKGD